MKSERALKQLRFMEQQLLQLEVVTLGSLMNASRKGKESEQALKQSRVTEQQLVQCYGVTYDSSMCAYEKCRIQSVFLSCCTP